MNLKDISTIRRILGFIEGVAISLPKDTQSAIYDYLGVADSILNNEEGQVLKGGAE